MILAGAPAGRVFERPRSLQPVEISNDCVSLTLDFRSGPLQDLDDALLFLARGIPLIGEG